MGKFFLSFILLFYIQLSFGNGLLAKDKFIFKISGQVFTIKEIQSYFINAKDLYCIFEDSLLYRVFYDGLSLNDPHLFAINKEYTEKQKEFFSALLPFGKLLIYIRSYNIKIKPSIRKYFYLLAKKNKCNLLVFENDKTFNPKFQEILELETFLRTRFLPTEIQGQTEKDDLEKAVVSAKNLLNSINEQLEQEIYW